MAANDLATIRLLAGQNPAAVFVAHQPHTAAYERAAVELDNLILHGHELARGEVFEAVGEEERLVAHVVAWLDPLNPGECGTYGVFKVFADDDGPYQAVLFAFYDGRKGRPGWKSETQARAWMRVHHPEYREVKS